MASEQITLVTAGEQGLVPCRHCETSKLKSEFYDSHIRADGRAGECKECTKARVKHRARSNPAVQEYDRSRAKLPHRRERARAVTKKWRAENPDGYKAHSAVSNAVRDGRLAKEPCVFCRSKEVHAHHKDYSKPLDVVWLCPKCHHRMHHIFPETEGINKSEART